MHSATRRFVVAAASLGLISGCGGGGSKDTPREASASVQIGGTITVVGAYDPTTLNIKSTRSRSPSVMGAVWRGVWRVTPDFRFLLNTDLVTSAELTSTDPQTVVYRINPAAVWSDGVPVSVDDFIYNWQVTRPGATDIDGTPIQGVGAPGGGDPIASVTGSDGGRTVTVVWKNRNIQWQTGVFNQLVPAHVARRVGFNTGFDRFDPDVMVSIGPFRVASFNPGSDATLVRNERYWGSAAALDRVVFRFTAEEAGVGAFNNGESDIVHGAAVPDVVAQLERRPGVRMSVVPGLGQEYIGFSQRNELLAVPDVRKAFALALDRRSIVERVLSKGSSAGVVNSFLWANNQPEYRDTSGGRYDRPDVAGAKRILEGAGWALGPDGVYAKEGKRLSFRISAVAAAPHHEEAQLIQAQVKAAGIELRIETAALEVMGPQLQKGDFDVAITSYGKNQFGTVNLTAPGNALGYSSPQLAQLFQQALAELDTEKRLPLLEQADRLLWNDLPLLPLYQRPLLVAVRDTFANIEPNPALGLGVFWNVEQWARKSKP